MTTADPMPAARRRRGAAGLVAAVLLGAACSGGGGSSREDVIDTLTDENLENPLSTEDAACAYDALVAEFDGDLDQITSSGALDDDEAALVAEVARIVELCVRGTGPQPD